jgi:hypothetical protein
MPVGWRFAWLFAWLVVPWQAEFLCGAEGPTDQDAAATGADRQVPRASALGSDRDLPRPPPAVHEFLAAHCVDCHNRDTREGGLDLESLSFQLDQREIFDRWVLVHDRVRDGEMPPPDDGIARPIVPVGWSTRTPDDREARSTESSPGDPDISARHMLPVLAEELITADRARVARTGRAMTRRRNRFEYENALREVLRAPWLQVTHRLPEDGIAHLFNKIGTQLDVSHVQMTGYFDAAQYALGMAIGAAAHPTQTRRFYAREEPAVQHYLHYRFGQTSATRSVVPLLDNAPEVAVIRGEKPITVGDADPDRREREAMGVFCGVYEATTKYDFTRVDAPTDGQYRLRFKTYTFLAGPHGASGGDDEGLTGGSRKWWRPDRNRALPGLRSEPITLYALAPSGESRWLTTFDSHPQPSVFEGVVSLRQGEGIRPDAARLVRTRPGWSGNPHATLAGVPGFAMHWLEVEGPLYPAWPPPSYRSVLGDLPFEVTPTGEVKALSRQPSEDARRLLSDLLRRALVDREPAATEVEPYVGVFDTATALGVDFTNAMIAAAAAILCAPEFIFLDAPPGRLSEGAYQQRLAHFLWNGPTKCWESADQTAASCEPRAMVDRLLADPRSDRFVSAFLDYWLDLRDLNANAPDAELYPDYYLDELLTESSLLETRRFFRDLIDRDLPARNLVAADFTYLNERLAQHYRLPPVEGVQLRRVDLPADSPQGGLLTQASVLRVTANGTTTSPVVRGAWVAERILGVEIPPPPSGVAAIEPDTRGATTIREQLQAHRADESCHACHARFDPIGCALESFDVTGGWRERYRALGEQGEPVVGLGKNGHAFRFKLAQEVDCTGTLADGRSFRDIRELKQLLVSQQRQLARNLLVRMIAFATGAPVSFGDRPEIEAMLDRAGEHDYGVRTLLYELAESHLMRHK